LRRSAQKWAAKEFAAAGLIGAGMWADRLMDN
jgi:hypothetical protein